MRANEGLGKVTGESYIQDKYYNNLLNPCDHHSPLYYAHSLHMYNPDTRILFRSKFQDYGVGDTPLG